MAENLNVNVNVNTNPAIQALNRLQQQVQTLESKFSGLGATIAALGFGVAIRNTIQYADALVDLSDSTNIAVSDLLQFQKAVELSGGNAEKAQQAVGKLTLSIDEAAQGGKKVQQAFSEVGVSIEDLRNLSEKDILQKTVVGLSKITDAGKRAALAQELLGKTARNLNYTNLATQFGTTSAESIRAAESFKKLADFQDKLDRTTQKLRESLASTLGPFLEKINQIPQEKLNEIVESFIKLSASIATLAVSIAGIQKLILVFGSLTAVAGGLFAMFKSGTAQTVDGTKALAKTFTVVKEKISAFLRGTPRFANLAGPIAKITKLIVELGASFRYLLTLTLIPLSIGLGKILLVLAAVAGAFFLVNEAVKLLTNKSLVDWAIQGINYLGDLTKRVLGLGDGIESLRKRASTLEPMADIIDVSDLPEMPDIPKPKMQFLSDQEVSDEIKRFEKLSQARRKVISAEEKELSTASLLLKQQSDTLKTNLELARERTRIDVDNLTNQNQILSGQKEGIFLSEDELNKKRMLFEIDQERKNAIRDITKEIEKLNLEIKLGSEDKTLSGRIRLLEQQKNTINGIYNVHKQEMPALMQQLKNQQVLEQDRLQTLQNITQEIEQQIGRQQTLGGLIGDASEKLKDVEFAGQLQKMSPLEQQFANIQEAARKAAIEAGRSFAAQFENMDLTDDKAQELADGLAQIADKYKQIADAQTQQLQYSQTWEAGWSGAFQSFAENATNAANMARDAVSASVNAMNSAIDRFVETGKFSFRDFATSIIQELIKIELKAAAMQIFKYIRGGSSGGSIISGLLSGLGFANGGNPPMNKLSLVGEKGPELFMPKQPGTIIPNDQLAQFGKQEQVVNNYYTYNVSAIDNKSVAQFFAEHRKTMLGTVQLAQKEMPYNNR